MSYLLLADSHTYVCRSWDGAARLSEAESRLVGSHLCSSPLSTRPDARGLTKHERDRPIEHGPVRLTS